MLLSKLVYLCVKSAILFDDKDFTYEAFVEGSYDEDPDYSQNINNIFIPINEAIARLSDTEKIPYVVNGIDFSDLEDKIVLPFSKLEKPVKQIISVAQLYGGQYRTLAWRPFGQNQILISSYIDPSKKIYVEYKEDVKHFDSTNFNEDMKDYGITDSMCNFIMEYSQGRLTENVSADLANMHITRSEQYFANISFVTSAFNQENVESVFTIGN